MKAMSPITSADLRIGNIIHDGLSMQILTVEGIGKNQEGSEAPTGVWFKDGGWTALSDDEEVFGFITGVTITKQWLDKSCLHNYKDNLWIDGRCEIVFDLDSMSLHLHNEVDGELYFVSRVPTIHQLQNLAFAITRFEIDFKINTP